MSESIKVFVESPAPTIRLVEIANGTFFLGTIDGFVSAGPFLKTGSVSERLWCVVKLEAMHSVVWVSSREKDRNTVVTGFQPISVKEIVLR